MGHQEIPAVRGQDGLHSRRRNLQRLGQGPPLAAPWISRQCCPPSRGELTGHQQEPHAVHGPLLQLHRSLPPAEEQTGSPACRHRYAKPQALPQGTRQEADRMWPVRIPVPGALCGPGCQRLVWPHTSGPRSLKNQLHSTWPPRPHSLARWPRTHSGCERALVHACGQACGRACWPAGMRPCLARGFASGRGLVRALTPTWLRQPRASHRSVLPF